MRPKKGTIYDVCITEEQTHTSTSSQHTRPGTADKAIQCEILTSEGIMLPWEELCTPYRGKNTEHTMSPESESMKSMQGYGNGLETLEHNSFQLVSAQHAQRQTKSVKRKEQNVEVKSKKRKTSSAATSIRVSPRLGTLNVQHEVSIEPKDQPSSVNLVNQVQTTEENANDQPWMSQSGTMNQQHGNQESTFNQLWSSQSDTANGMQAMQENTTNHLQPSQVDTVNHMQTSQENTAHELQLSPADAVIPIQTMQEYTTDQASQADTVNHIQTNKEDTAHELQSSLADTVFQVRTMQEYTTDQPSQAGTMNHVQMNQENIAQMNQVNIANQLQSGLADTVISISAPQESTSNHSQPSDSDLSQIQANQENTDDQLQLSQADTVTQIQIMQENMTRQLQLSQADTMNEIDINLEISTNHLQQNYAENHMLQAGFSWAPEQNGGALITDFWKNVENQESLVPIQIDGAPVASFPENVKFQNAAAAEPVIPTQAALPGTASDQSGSAFPSLFGNAWSDPCIEFAFKTLTGDIPVLDDTSAVTDYFPQQQDLNKGTTPPNCSATAFDNARNHTQVDVNLPLPMPSDNFYNGSWFPPQ
uniref:Uncharacterized protein n=1 Tax=Arundo donax TaxID=35708 RepID=A0A0A9D9V5_ARUDO